MRGAIRQQNQSTNYAPIVEDENQAFLKPDEEDGDTHLAGRSPRHRLQIEEPMTKSATAEGHAEGRLSVRETAWLSFEFCILWVCPESRW